MPNKKKDVVSQKDIELAKDKTKQGLKYAFAVGCYKSETDDEIGRSKEHAKHMRRTRRQNFGRKMNLIDPHYGKKAAGVLAAGTALGLAATTLPGIGAVAGPTVGGAVIAGGLAFIETDAHRAVGDHAILDSLLDDRDDNWRTNATLHGFDGHGDKVSEFDKQQMLTWSDEDDDDLDNLLPEGFNETKYNQQPQQAQQKTKSNPLFDSLDDDDDEDDSSQNLFNSMESLGLNNSNNSSKQQHPRPPSPQHNGDGGGQRFTNPHSSSAVQLMGNDFGSNNSNSSNINLAKQDFSDDDFFASFNSNNSSFSTQQNQGSFDLFNATSQPTPNTQQMNIQYQEQTHSQEQNKPQNNSDKLTDDFFANFGGSSSSSSSKTSNGPRTTLNEAAQKSNPGSFFATVATHIPSNSASSSTKATSPPPNTNATPDFDDPFADLYARPSTSKPSSNYSALQGMRSF